VTALRPELDPDALVVPRGRPGSARAALAHRDFRVVYIGAFASNIGTWMQNVVLAAWAHTLTGSASFVGVIIFAQLGPLLFVTPIGGLLADRFDRRRLLIAAQVAQMAMTTVLAGLALDDSPNLALIVVVVFSIGMGNAINAPTWSATIPLMVGRRDLPGAISLNSTQMNGSRVIGPAIGGLLFPWLGPAFVFLLNALTFLAVIAVLIRVTLPPIPTAAGRSGWRQILGGIDVARTNPVVARSLVLLATFSLLAITFVGQMPVVAHDNFGIDPESFAYGALYALFGLGAMFGSLAQGTVWSDRSKAAAVPRALMAYAALLLPFALASEPATAFPLAFAVGFAYFTFITSLSTTLQDVIDDGVRGRVMALWIMGFGGMVPIGNLVAGPIIEATSMRAVMVFGVVVALILARFADLRRLGATA